MNKQQLFENIKKKQSFLCVGLDTDIKKIPEHSRSSAWGSTRTSRRFPNTC